MTTRNALIASVLLTAAVLLYTVAVYPSLPERVPIHWNIHGQPDGWAPKQAVFYTTPVFMAVMAVLIVVLPWASPRRFSVEEFRGTFNYLMLVAIGLFAYIHAIMLRSALHPEEDLGRALIAGLLLFLAVMGNSLGKVRRNFWVGIRTPWTLASERVWNATHRLGARVMTIAGIAGAVAVLLGAPVWLCFTLVMAAIVYPVFYSLWLYKSLERAGEL